MIQGVNWKGKRPLYVKGVIFSLRPTALDPVGIKGYYIKSMTIAWWGWLFIFFRGLKRRIACQLWKWRGAGGLKSAGPR